MTQLHRHKIGGEMVLTHGPDQCGDEPCPIHNPSDHHMVGWELSLQNGGHPLPLMLRTCPHGYEHPDPDSLPFYQAMIAEPADEHMRDWHEIHGLTADNIGLHLCDGCCRP